MATNDGTFYTLKGFFLHLGQKKACKETTL